MSEVQGSLGRRRNVSGSFGVVVQNADLRLRVAEMVYRSGEGHIPSSFSILDILEVLYRSVLKFNSGKPNDPGRDFFVLSKGHGAAALFAVLNKYGFLTDGDIDEYGSAAGILGGHPDATKVAGAEFSTGSLGHGFPMSVGVALGLKIDSLQNQVFVLVGDGECHEGTIWESANVAVNNGLDNLTAIVDWNGSAAQLMPTDDLPAKWEAFGWETLIIDGHNSNEVQNAALKPRIGGIPRAIIAKTTKGYGVDFISGHGQWHHKIPSADEMTMIRNLLRVGGV